MEIPDSSRRSSASSGNRISSSNMNTTLFQCLWEGCPQTNPFSSMDEVYAHYRDSHVFGINSSGRDLNCKVGVKSEFESTTSPILCNVHVCSRADLLDHLASHFPLGFKPFACKFCENKYRQKKTLHTHELQHHRHLLVVEKKPYFPRKGKHHARITSTDSIDSFTSSTSSSASSSISSSPIRTSFTEKRTLLSPYDTSWNGGVGEGGRGGRSSIHVAGRHSISGSDAHHFLNIPSTIGEDHKRFKGHKKSISLSNYVSVSSSSATIPYPHYHHTTNNSLPPPPRGYYQQSLEQRSLEHPVVQLRMPPISRLHIGSGNRIHRDANIVETSYVTSSSSSSSASPSTTSRFTYNNDPNFDQSIINGPAETSNIVVAVVNSNPFSLASLLSK